MVREPLYGGCGKPDAIPELLQLVVPRLVSPRTVCCSTCSSRTAPSKTYLCCRWWRGAITAGVVGRGRGGRRLCSCSDCRAKKENARTKSALPRTRRCRLRPRKHCAPRPAHGRLQRLQSGSHLRFARCRRSTLQAIKRAHSSVVVASNVQQVYLTLLLECNTPVARGVAPKGLPSSGMISS